MVQVLAPAKLNLGLRILSRREDGYHEIETLFVPLAFYDRLEITPTASSGIELEISGAELPRGPDNLVVRAAEATCRALALPAKLRVLLEKRIPVAAGLGGGSSDAAATMLGLEALAGQRLPAAERRAIAVALGADVPFFLEPRPALARGVGERLDPLAGVPELWWVLVLLPFQVSTARAYRTTSARLTLPKEPSSIAALLGPLGLISSPLNDLEAAATACHEEIAAVRGALESAGARGTGMSGSGPTVYGGFRGRAEAEEAARSVHLPRGARTVAVSSPSSDSTDFEWGVAKW